MAGQDEEDCLKNSKSVDLMSMPCYIKFLTIDLRLNGSSYLIHKQRQYKRISLLLYQKRDQPTG